MRIKHRTKQEQFLLYDKVIDMRYNTTNLSQIARCCDTTPATVKKITYIYEALRDNTTMPAYCAYYPGIVEWATTKFPQSPNAAKYKPKPLPKKHNYTRYCFRTNDIYRYIAIGKQSTIANVVSYNCTPNHMSIVFDNGNEMTFSFVTEEDINETVRIINRYLNGYFVEGVHYGAQ